MNHFKKIDIRKYSNILVFSISLIPLILFLYVIWNRTFTPFVFGWGESAGVNQILRIQNGYPLFARPTIEFAPLVYTPLYYYIAAGFSKIVGSALFSARILSIISVIGSVFLIIRIVHKETKNALLAWLAGMVYLACFALSSGFYDLARVDSLYIFVALTVFSLLLDAKNYTGYLLAGVLLVVGFFIKQSFLFIFLPLQVYLLVKRWKYSWVIILVEVLGLSIPLYLVNRSTEGWLFYYIFELPKEHGYSFISAVNFWIGDTIQPLGILFGFGLVYLLFAKLELKGLDPMTEGISNKDDLICRSINDRWWIFILFFLGAAGAAWITRTSNGGGPNNCMMIYAALAIAFGLGAGVLFKTRWVKENHWAYAFLSLLIALQFIGLVYNPFVFIPTGDEFRINNEVTARIEHSDRPVLIPYRSHLSAELTENYQVHMVNLFELTGYFKGKIQPEGYDLINQIRGNICQQVYGLIILDQPVPWFEDQIDEVYVLDLDLADNEYLGSELLNWQQGSARTYTPKPGSDSEKCLHAIPAGWSE